MVGEAIEGGAQSGSAEFDIGSVDRLVLGDSRKCVVDLGSCDHGEHAIRGRGAQHPCPRPQAGVFSGFLWV
jgi:hypothetical protein